VQAHPSLSEPFALIAPYRVERDGIFKAFDVDGHQLVLNRSERRGAVLAFYDLLADGVEPAWIAGRLTDTGATVCLTPFALGTRDRAYTRL
jgi:CHASE2 domain-containing sensor protein